MKKTEIKFEDNLMKLNEIVNHLEQGDLELSDALKSFEEGIKLYKTCHDVLENAEQSVKILIDDLEIGDKIEVPFNGDGE